MHQELHPNAKLGKDSKYHIYNSANSFSLSQCLNIGHFFKVSTP